MVRMVTTSAAVLACAVMVSAQGFENTSYTSTPTASSSSDKKLSIFLSAGYGFALGGVSSIDGLGSLVSDTYLNGNMTESDDKYANAGRGLKIDLGAAYRAVEHVDVKLAFDMGFGLPSIECIEHQKWNPVGVLRESKTTLKVSTNQFGLKLMLAPRFTIADLIDVYVGAGLGLYWTAASYEIEDYTIDATGTKTIDTEEGKIDTKAAIPFIGQLGLEYPISRMLIIYLDATYQAMNVTIQSVKAEKSTFANPTSEEFENDDQNDPAPPKIPGSNLAIRLGVRVPLF